MSEANRSYAYAITAVLFWSTVATAFKIALRHLDVFQLLLYASATSTIVLFVVLVATRKLDLLARQSRADYGRSALLGILNPFLYYLVLFRAYDLLPAQQAQPLNYTWPIVLVLLSIPLLKQRIGLRSIVAVCISFFGVLLISTEGRLTTLQVDNLEGVLLAVGSSAIWAVYWIFNVRDSRDAVVKLFMGFAFGLVAILPLAPILSDGGIPSWQGLAGAAYVGLFEMGVTFVVWLRALQLARTTAQVGILVYFSPFLSLIFIQLILREDILPATLAGLVFIVGGIVVQQYGELFQRNAKKGTERPQ